MTGHHDDKCINNQQEKSKSKMVIGMVKTTSIGFTMVFSKDKTAATRIPVIAESMCTPGNM